MSEIVSITRLERARASAIRAETLLGDALTAKERADRELTDAEDFATRTRDRLIHLELLWEAEKATHDDVTLLHERPA